MNSGSQWPGHVALTGRHEHTH